MNAQQWLQEQQLANPKVVGTHPGDDLFPGYDCSVVMERFANLKSKDLQAQVLGFFQRLKCAAQSEQHPERKMAYQLALENYQTFFNIITDTHG